MSDRRKKTLLSEGFSLDNKNGQRFPNQAYAVAEI